MKASELRIGNILLLSCDSPTPYFKPKNGTIEVCNILEDCINFNIHNEGDEVPISFVSGIPLTEDWLVKLGAKECDDNSWRYKISVGAISLSFRKNSGTWYSEIGGIYLGDKLMFVHHVQNIYHSFMHTELNLTPSPANNNLKNI